MKDMTCNIICNYILNTLDPVVFTVDVFSSQKHNLYDFKPKMNCEYKLIPCGDELTRTQQIATLASLSLVLISNVTYSHAKREISESSMIYLKRNTLPIGISYLLFQIFAYCKFQEISKSPL